MPINRLSLNLIPNIIFPSTSDVNTPENKPSKIVKAVSHENIEMIRISEDITIFDYLYQARKHYVENKQNCAINVYDKMFLQELINGEKKRKPSLNIKLSDSPLAFSAEIKSLNNDIYSGQYIINMGNGAHYAALDLFIKNNQISIIIIEPSSLKNMGASLLFFRLKSRMQDEHPTAKMVLLESNIQHSPVDCAIFSLHFTLKMHLLKRYFEALHLKHLNGGLSEDAIEGIISMNNVDKYLPVQLMKHTNSKNRLIEYFQRNEKNPPIFAMEKMIIDRQRRYTFDRGDRNYSASIEDKRIKLIERSIKIESIKID